MSRLANERHELYALHRAKGMIPKKAAIAAGFAAGSSIYSTLEEDAEMVTRISELTHDIQLKREQNRAAALEAAKMVGQVTGLTKSWVLQRLAENAVAARDDGMYKESNDALKMIGDEFGMFKGTSSDDENDPTKRTVIDLDKTVALLDNASDAMQTINPTVEKPVDMELVERLISGNKPVRQKDRVLTTGSETDVAMKPDSEIPPEDEKSK